MSTDAPERRDPRRNLLVMILQLLVSAASTWLVGGIYFPEVLEGDLRTALMPIAVMHMFRFIGMTMVMPGQVDPRISEKACVQIALGDLAVAATAVLLTAILSTDASHTTVVACAWLFIVTCFADMANIQRFFIGEQFWNKDMGVVYLFQVLLSMPMVFGEVVALYRLVVG